MIFGYGFGWPIFDKTFVISLSILGNGRVVWFNKAEI